MAGKTMTSKFTSQRLGGRRLVLAFERIGDSYWTNAAVLRALVAELDRLEVPDGADVQLKYRTADDELDPPGWSLNLTVKEAGRD